MKTAHKIEDPDEMLVKAQPMSGPPGLFIRDVIIPEYGLTVAGAARLLNVNRPNFIDVIEGRLGVSRTLAYKLGALLGDPVCDLLLAWQHKYDLEREADERASYRATIERIQPPAARGA